MTLTKKEFYQELHDYLLILVGLVSYTIGWVVFLLPNNIATGGVPGISSILYWASKIPVQATFFAVNAVLLLLALKILGWKFCVKTIYGVVSLTIILSIFQQLVGDMHLLKDEPFMAAVLGGCFCGIGIGLGLSCNGSSGGTDIVAAIIHKYKDISLGRLILMVDLLVITSSYVVLRDWERVIYGYVVLYVTAFCIDQVVNNMRRSVQFFIISEHYKEIGDRIIAHFDAGISEFYDEKDLQNGYIETRNRAGQLERINIMSISIIVMYSDEIRSTPVNEVYKRMMLYKKRAKMVRGSVLLKDFN